MNKLEKAVTEIFTKSPELRKLLPMFSYWEYGGKKYFHDETPMFRRGPRGGRQKFYRSWVSTPESPCLHLKEHKLRRDAEARALSLFSESLIKSGRLK